MVSASTQGQRRINAGLSIQSQTAEAGSVRARQLTADAGPGRGEGGAGPPGMDPEGAGEPRIGRCLFPTPASAEKLRQRKYQMMTPNAHSVGETEATYLEGLATWAGGLTFLCPVMCCRQASTDEDAR